MSGIEKIKIIVEEFGILIIFVAPIPPLLILTATKGCA
jgi:hypothetical protein